MKATRMRSTSSRRNICLHPGQSVRCTIIVKNPKSEYPDIWIRLPKHTLPQSWSSMEDPVVLLERNPYGHLLAGLFWEGQFEKVYWNTVGKKFQIGNACSLTEEKDYSCPCMWTI